MHGVFIPSLAGIQLLFKAILPERIGVNTLFYLPFSVSATGFCGRLYFTNYCLFLNKALKS